MPRSLSGFGAMTAAVTPGRQKTQRLKEALDDASPEAAAAGIVLTDEEVDAESVVVVVEDTA